ncbi:hypothetical protein BC938DRAFT_472668 [Jimgerdemannia flammicorona]|uniref:Uncharacterized protein n=1 Tax=Jimgerdemannia flammicorona TaxID=994334 RepID=A0A433Q5M2_9FUNG|nr:hypothetical protein BC938DRAFT_472668 [Jimgerdemannia flammicorona]
MLSTTYVVDDQACERIRVALESYDVSRDIAMFVGLKSTGVEVPEPIPYQNFFAIGGGGSSASLPDLDHDEDFGPSITLTQQPLPSPKSSGGSAAVHAERQSHHSLPPTPVPVPVPVPVPTHIIFGNEPDLLAPPRGKEVLPDPVPFEPHRYERDASESGPVESRLGFGFAIESAVTTTFFGKLREDNDHESDVDPVVEHLPTQDGEELKAVEDQRRSLGSTTQDVPSTGLAMAGATVTAAEPAPSITVHAVPVSEPLTPLPQQQIRHSLAALHLELDNMIVDTWGSEVDDNDSTGKIGNLKVKDSTPSPITSPTFSQTSVIAAGDAGENGPVIKSTIAEEIHAAAVTPLEGPVISLFNGLAQQAQQPPVVQEEIIRTIEISAQETVVPDVVQTPVQSPISDHFGTDTKGNVTEVAEEQVQERVIVEVRPPVIVPKPRQRAEAWKTSIRRPEGGPIAVPKAPIVTPKTPSVSDDLIPVRSEQGDPLMDNFSPPAQKGDINGAPPISYQWGATASTSEELNRTHEVVAVVTAAVAGAEILAQENDKGPAPPPKDNKWIPPAAFAEPEALQSATPIVTKSDQDRENLLNFLKSGAAPNNASDSSQSSESSQQEQQRKQQVPELQNYAPTPITSTSAPTTEFSQQQDPPQTPPPTPPQQQQTSTGVASLSERDRPHSGSSINSFSHRDMSDNPLVMPPRRSSMQPPPREFHSELPATRLRLSLTRSGIPEEAGSSPQQQQIIATSPLQETPTDDLSVQQPQPSLLQQQAPLQQAPLQRELTPLSQQQQAQLQQAQLQQVQLQQAQLQQAQLQQAQLQWAQQQQVQQGQLQYAQRQHQQLPPLPQQQRPLQQLQNQPQQRQEEVTSESGNKSSWFRKDQFGKWAGKAAKAGAAVAAKVAVAVVKDKGEDPVRPASGDFSDSFVSTSGTVAIRHVSPVIVRQAGAAIGTKLQQTGDSEPTSDMRDAGVQLQSAGDPSQGDTSSAFSADGQFNLQGDSSGTLGFSQDTNKMLPPQPVQLFSNDPSQTFNPSPPPSMQLPSDPSQAISSVTQNTTIQAQSVQSPPYGSTQTLTTYTQNIITSQSQSSSAQPSGDVASQGITSFGQNADFQQTSGNESSQTVADFDLKLSSQSARLPGHGESQGIGAFGQTASIPQVPGDKASQNFTQNISTQTQSQIAQIPGLAPNLQPEATQPTGSTDDTYNIASQGTSASDQSLPWAQRQPVSDFDQPKGFPSFGPTYTIPSGQESPHQVAATISATQNGAQSVPKTGFLVRTATLLNDASNMNRHGSSGPTNVGSAPQPQESTALASPPLDPVVIKHQQQAYPHSSPTQQGGTPTIMVPVMMAPVGGGLGRQNSVAGPRAPKNPMMNQQIPPVPQMPQQAMQQQVMQQQVMQQQVMQQQAMQQQAMQQQAMQQQAMQQQAMQQQAMQQQAMQQQAMQQQAMQQQATQQPAKQQPAKQQPAKQPGAADAVPQPSTSGTVVVKDPRGLGSKMKDIMLKYPQETKWPTGPGHKDEKKGRDREKDRPKKDEILAPEAVMSSSVSVISQWSQDGSHREEKHRMSMNFLRKKDKDGQKADGREHHLEQPQQNPQYYRPLSTGSSNIQQQQYPQRPLDTQQKTPPQQHLQLQDPPSPASSRGGASFQTIELDPSSSPQFRPQNGMQAPLRTFGTPMQQLQPLPAPPRIW